ncbi:MAG: DNA recombination protein RmuC [Pseudomonadota bacterium]
MNTFDPSAITFAIGGTIFTLTQLLVAAFAVAILLGLYLLARGNARRAERERAERERAQIEAQARAQQADERLSRVAQAQAELGGHLTALQQGVTGSQEAFSRQLDERMGAMRGQVAASLNENREQTHASLTGLQERLAVIDTAQNNIQGLAQNVVGLQAILENKQTRGAFGEARMETIIRDGLPMGAYEFQATLSNRSRPDCTIIMPNDAPSLVIDAKFPLEAWTAMRDAENDHALKDAARRFNTDMEAHIKAVSEKYLIAGETQDTVFLFVPSESIFAEIHERFDRIVQKAHRARVVIVSPSLLLLSIQVIQALLKDARMREQAHLIQAEVAKFAQDLERLDDRVAKLQSHFAMTQKDVEQILTSTGKLKRHGDRIEAMEFHQPVPERAESGKPFLRAIDGGD